MVNLYSHSYSLRKRLFTTSLQIFIFVDFLLLPSNSLESDSASNFVFSFSLISGSVISFSKSTPLINTIGKVVV